MSIGNKEATKQMKSAYKKFLIDNDKVDIYSTRKYFYEGYNCAKKELEEQLNEAELIIDELFEWDNLTGNEVHRLKLRFQELKEKWE